MNSSGQERDDELMRLGAAAGFRPSPEPKKKRRNALRSVQVGLDFLATLLLWFFQLIGIGVLLCLGLIGFWKVENSCHQIWTSEVETKGSYFVFRCFVGPPKHLQGDDTNEESINSPSPIADVEGPRPESDPKQEPGKKPERKPDPDPLLTAFQGLEFLLLAPLFFLLIRSLTQYILDLDATDTESRHEGDGTSSAAQAKEKISAEIEHGKEALFETKALSIGLLFAIVGTHLVGNLISGEYSQHNNATLSEESILGLALVVVLGTAFLTMEVIARRKKWHRGKGHRHSELGSSLSAE